MTERLHVMVVDDERLTRLTLLRQLLQDGYLATAVDNGQQAIEALESGDWDVVVSDMRMPVMGGLELLHVVKAQFPWVDVILITAYGSVEMAVTAIQEGAADYLTKPFRFPELAFRLRKLEEIRDARKVISSIRAFLDNAPSFCGIVGHSPLIRSVCKRIQTFAGSAVPVLVTGETGTGKELVARALHMQSERSYAPFVGLSCGSIPREIAESELFGHEKGAFTNAVQRHKGTFERAHKGALLLDDVDDLPLDIQVKLLRVVQEQVLTRVGGAEEVRVDVRLIATTKRNLEELVREGKFRDDLFYRLRGLEIHLPPLRERGDDALLLAQHFLDLLAERSRAVPKRIDADSAAMLRAYGWPGNVRELRRAMESAFVVCDGPVVTTAHLPEYLRQASPRSDDARALFTLHLDGTDALDFNQQVHRFEETLIHWALTCTGGSQSQAADLLDLPRTTFQSKLNRGRKD